MVTRVEELIYLQYAYYILQMFYFSFLKNYLQNIFPYLQNGGHDVPFLLP